MRITIAAATKFELNEDTLKQAGRHEIYFIYTGVGILASAVSLTQHILQHKPDLIIQAGIAGCFYQERHLGEVIAVQSECVGDLGVKQNGKWNDLFDMGFVAPDETPYEMSFLPNNHIYKFNVLHLPVARGITVNEITTDEQTIWNMKTIYNGEVESMEGASLHYVCRLYNVPFIQIRAISNYVGERDKTKWKIKEAIINLNETVLQMLHKIE